MEISSPRMSRCSLADIVSRSRPLKRISPPVTKPGGLSRIPMMACALTDLPQPDSPRIASVSPADSVYEMPLTAWTTP